METNGNQTTYLQTTFQQIAPNADAFAARFYEHLFELEPALRAMFKNDMAEQRRKLVQILAVVVNSLDRFEELTPAVENLGNGILAMVWNKPIMRWLAER